MKEKEILEILMQVYKEHGDYCSFECKAKDASKLIAKKLEILTNFTH